MGVDEDEHDEAATAAMATKTALGDGGLAAMGACE